MPADASSTLPPLPTFLEDEKVCGNCKLWQAHSVEHRGRGGPGRPCPNSSLVPPGAPRYGRFAATGRTTPAPARPTRQVRNVAPVVVRKQKDVEEPVDLGGDLTMTRQELMEIFREAAGEVEVPLAPKWEGGVIQIIPGKRELQAKELPIDALFHKVVMIRDRLRTLEQRINAHAKLTDAAKT